MSIRLLGGAALVTCALYGCGGGGGSSGAGTVYPYVTPTLDAQRTYSETIVDNSNNTIDLTIVDETTAVNSDATSTQVSQTTGGSDPVNGTVYGNPAETQSFNAMGQETSYEFTGQKGAVVTCTYDPHGPGPNFPVEAGDTWTLTYTLTCGSNAPVTHQQTGSVVDVESVTVPAGTFSALKTTSTETWTDAAGTTRTESVTSWRDVATSRSVQQNITIAYSGTLPTSGYAVSRDIVLQSITTAQ